MSYLPHTEEEIREMLDEIGVDEFEDLLNAVPEEVRQEEPLQIPEALSEQNLLKHLQELAEKNRDLSETTSFLGGGMYFHFVPAVVEELTGRNEFYTAYTPYQPEASQGILQAFYEYQTLICELTGMDISNASHYDGPSALAEAVLMLAGHEEKGASVLVPQSLNPEFRRVLETYLQFHNLSIETVPFDESGTTAKRNFLEAAENSQPAAAILQNPNFFGCLEPVQEIAPELKDRDIPLVAVAEPVSLAYLSPPGDWPAEVAVGEGQPLGNDLSYGGPTFGFMSTTEDHLRDLPGRIVGETTTEEEDQKAFVLTLQTREQHIRRERATSNICTNQGLLALRATIWMCALGKQGFQKVANHSLQKAHYLKDNIASLDGFQPAFEDTPFFNEFVVECPVPPDELNRQLLEHNIIGGLDLSSTLPDLEHPWLLSATEWVKREEIDRFVDLLKHNNNE